MNNEWTKLAVPFCSQKDADFAMSPRVCGIASLRMILGYHYKNLWLRNEIPSLNQMVADGRKAGGYIPELGWRHDYLIGVARGYGLTAYRREYKNFPLGIAELYTALKEKNPPMVSGWKTFFGGTRGSHLVVLSGYHCVQGEDLEVCFHDPELGTKDQGAYIPVSSKEFENGWRKMAIFFSK